MGIGVIIRERESRIIAKAVPFCYDNKENVHCKAACRARLHADSLAKKPLKFGILLRGFEVTGVLNGCTRYEA